VEFTNEKKHVYELSGLLSLIDVPWTSPEVRRMLNEFKQLCKKHNIQCKMGYNELVWKFYTPTQDVLYYVGDAIESFFTRINGNHEDDYPELQNKLRWKNTISTGMGSRIPVDYEDQRFRDSAHHFKNLK
jgi:hypothetical protein